jgi:hypothetical protein
MVKKWQKENKTEKGEKKRNGRKFCRAELLFCPLF